MKRYFALAAAAFMALATTFTSCSDVTLDNTPYSEPVSNVQYTQSKKDITVTWTSPAGAEEIALFLDNTQKASVPASQTSYTFKNVADGNLHVFTLKAVYKSAGRISEGVSFSELIESKTKAAFLLPTGVADYTALPDDDEQAAGEYFKRAFVDENKGSFIHVSDIAGLDVDATPVIWVMVDRVAIGRDLNNLPYSASDINALKDYVKKGGNLYLSNHATMIATGIGRIDCLPTCFGDGAGGEHGDIWSVNTTLGSGMGTPYDRSSHAIFDGIEQANHNGWAQKTIGLLGPGTQEDHNCFWIPADVPGRTWGDNGDPNTVPDFEKALNCVLLGGWGQVTDYCVGGIIEFLPTGDYKGTVLINGFAAYEFHQDRPAAGDKNVFQNNIEKLTANALNYLK